MNSKSEAQVSLYEASEKIYPREVKGTFQRLRNLAVLVLLGLYYFVPWLQWQGRQAVLFDLPARKFYIFELVLWPQDFIFLTLLLILAGLSLFFFTALAGRVWCGYACPQTVWTEAFIWMERWIEGSRAQQMKLTAMPWNWFKIRKRVTKQVCWISFAFLTGMTFVGFFMPIRELVADLVNLELAGWSLFWVMFYGFATYGNAGFLREQVCMYMCPYARFQSAMFDKDTLIVAYNEERGEPRERGKRRKDQSSQQSGDCIDCGLCVQVCPTGIDIRDGLQYECIACAACIDACDQVMDKVQLDRGLIRYSSENRDTGVHNSLKTSLLRPRILIYAVLLSAVFLGFVTSLAMRSDLQVDILRDRNALYSIGDQGRVENFYQVKLMNKSALTRRYSIAAAADRDVQVTWGSSTAAGLSREVLPGELADLTAVVSMSAEQANNQKLSLVFRASDAPEQSYVQEAARFIAPRK